uniref:Uncharacterized protein n=1 Tax=Salix viminalis TaxID=40686 RepID=A0A6N2KFB1_SALVM
MVGHLREDGGREVKYSGIGSKMVFWGNLNINSIESFFSSFWFCSAPLPQPSSSYNDYEEVVPYCLVTIPRKPRRGYSSLCAEMEEKIGGTRLDEGGVIGEEIISSEFKLLKLRKLVLSGLLKLKSICCSKRICDSLLTMFKDLCKCGYNPSIFIR